jgi:hypothetical protein
MNRYRPYLSKDFAINIELLEALILINNSYFFIMFRRLTQPFLAINCDFVKSPSAAVCFIATTNKNYKKTKINHEGHEERLYTIQDANDR